MKTFSICFLSCHSSVQRACGIVAALAAVFTLPLPATAGFLIDPSGGTVLWNDSSNVDDQVIQRSIGFTGSFFGSPFTQVYVSTNGNLNFSGLTQYTNASLSSVPAMIAPLWDDLYIFQGSGQSITEKAVANQYYSVTWDVSQFENPTPRYQFQAVLFGQTTVIDGTTYLPNDIAFAYNRVDPSFVGGSAAVGLSNGNGTFATLSGLVSTGGEFGTAQTGLLPTAPGQFIVAAPDGSGYGGSFVTGVPEPSTYAMALAGLACGGYSMFRRRKQA
jgi:hypothetical protein